LNLRRANESSRVTISKEVGRVGRTKTVHQPVLFPNILVIKQVDGFLFFNKLSEVIFWGIITPLKNILCHI